MYHSLKVSKLERLYVRITMSSLHVHTCTRTLVTLDNQEGELGDKTTQSIHEELCITVHHVYLALSPKQIGATPGGQLRTFCEPLYTASTTTGVHTTEKKRT